MGGIKGLNTKKVSIFTKDYYKQKELQKRAFPKEEQYPFWILKLMALRKGVDYLAYYHNDLFCGISYTSSTEQMMYVLYLAVNDEIRSKGYGTMMLNYLRDICGKKEITLNVEPLDKNASNYEQRVRRMEFYNRNGFQNTGYRMIDDTGAYMVLSTAKDFKIEEYKKVIGRIAMNLYQPKIVKENGKYGT